LNITVLTLFPDMVDQVLNTSIIGRAIASGFLTVKTKNIRDNARAAYAKVDDAMFGGGTGMLMLCDPIYDSYVEVTKELATDSKPHTIFMSPKGKVFDQKRALELAQMDNIIFLCGHYEGVDERVLEEIVDEELSIGDYVLTGGELPACVVIDAVARLLPGVLPSEDAYNFESHMNSGLEHPQYTRPAVWRGRKVPDVLLSGHHEKIRKYNRIQGLYETMIKRPDIFDKMEVTEDDMVELISLAKANKSQCDRK
jgi:tRNA (guanine37-N1)-methyltransferase